MNGEIICEDNPLHYETTEQVDVCSTSGSL